MSYTLTIVCLANSRKMSGRCIAGKEWTAGRAGKWIRPVSGRENHEISESDRRYRDGSDPRLLDVIAIPFKQAAPSGHQLENHLIEDGAYWKKTGVVLSTDLAKIADRPATLWKNGFSSGSGTHDRVPIGDAVAEAGSLYLIPVDDLTLHVKAASADFSKRVVRAKFTYLAEHHDLRVTDPLVERDYFARPDGQYAIGPAFLCVSLGEPFGGHYYKLVAAVLTKVDHS